MLFNGTKLKSSKWSVRLKDGQVRDQDGFVLERNWSGSGCDFKLIHKGAQAFEIKEILLFQGKHELDVHTPVYGEGYSMLSQYGGTIGEIKSLTLRCDFDHYKIPRTKSFQTLFNLALISPDGPEAVLAAFASCIRFNGEIRFNETEFEIALVTDGIQMMPGDVWELEHFVIYEGDCQSELLEQLGKTISRFHPQLPVPETPSGWCSWYSYGPEVTEEDILVNMTEIANHYPELTYIQIDDGFQAYMGDWLIAKPGFKDMKELCQTIKDKGLKPAIWVAPFIAEKSSVLFREHPDWFIQDEQGNPLSSGVHSFGGWRCGPWYMLDGTHPEAQQYLTTVFRTMREEWNCTYFKLDANMWGALHGGVYYRPNSTRVEAYREGMKAVIKGAGIDSFILGCNAPMWPSLGVVHGMRITDDTYRKWEAFTRVARECFWRNWQHNTLWVNDPDCLLTHNWKINPLGPDGKRYITDSALTDDEFLFHATHIFCSGGMLLSGDVLTEMTEVAKTRLRKIIKPTDVPAVFDSTEFTIGRMTFDDRQMIAVFNWEDDPVVREVELHGSYEVYDFWNNEYMGSKSGFMQVELNPRSAKLYELKS